MVRFVRLCFGMLVRLFRRRQSLLLENLALRQQLVMLKRRHPRPSLGLLDKLFWVIARRVWSGWKPNGFLSSKVFTLCRSEDRIQSFSTKNGLVFGRD